MDDEYEKFIRRMNPPRVVIDNSSCEHATVIEVYSIKRDGVLLEVVQVLVDLNLMITKAYISSDGEWFMVVFHVTDHDGNKIREKGILNYIEKSLKWATYQNELPPMSLESNTSIFLDYTTIELTGTDRPGLLSEVCAVLTDLRCNVVNAEIWTHNARAAAVIHVADESTGCAVEDPKQLSMIKELLWNVLKGNNNLRAPKMTISTPGTTHMQRRLHQMMFADRDFERLECFEDTSSRPQVTILDCADRDYTVVVLRSRDRPKLFFDAVCTLTDMQYVVFHGTLITGRMEAYQEYYIRHIDGLPISSEAERQRVAECLEAAIERRTTEGLELELCTDDRFGLLSDVTRIFRENGLSIKRAEISTKCGKAKDSFFVTDVSGNPVEPTTVDLIRQQIGQTILRVKGNSAKLPQDTATSFLFGNFFRGRTFKNLVCNTIC